MNGTVVEQCLIALDRVRDPMFTCVRGGARQVAAGDCLQLPAFRGAKRGDQPPIDPRRAEDTPANHSALAFRLQPSALSLASMRRLNSSDWPRGIDNVFQFGPHMCLASSKI